MEQALKSSFESVAYYPNYLVVDAANYVPLTKMFFVILTVSIAEWFCNRLPCKGTGFNYRAGRNI